MGRCQECGCNYIDGQCQCLPRDFDRNALEDLEARAAAGEEAIERIAVAIGLPASATVDQIEARARHLAAMDARKDTTP